MAQKLKLMIVDDDPHIRRLLSLYLRRSPYEIREAVNGEEAARFWREDHPHVILLDLILPHFGGFQLCQKIRSEQDEPTRPYIIVMTGEDSPETRETAVECGADEFLAKPLDAEQVRERVDELAKRFA